MNTLQGNFEEKLPYIAVLTQQTSEYCVKIPNAQKHLQKQDFPYEYWRWVCDENCTTANLM